MRIAVIPARGGSKRIPRKNVKLFAGKPMIAHSIACAIESALFDRIVVSTDDDEIAAIATDCGAEVPFRRPPKLADDYAGTDEVMAHAVDALGAQAGVSAVCCIYPTAPFILAADLREALRVLDAGHHDYVFAAATFDYPIYRAFVPRPEGGVVMTFPEYYDTRSQDLPEALHDAGQFYWASPMVWAERRPVFGERSAVVRIPRWRVQDIDTEEDWARAEAMALYLAARA